MGIRTISKTLGVGRNTVRGVIYSGKLFEPKVATNTIEIDEALVRQLFRECKGYVERVWERLREEHGLDIAYSTLTRRVRSLGLRIDKPRADRVPDEPGAEMQYDTSPFIVQIDGKQMKVIAATLYFRYSKQIYAEFYVAFDRTRMQFSLHNAITYRGFSAPTCIVDNSNLAVLRGTGKNAVIVPEMEAFAKRYHFEFEAHELNHPNRKAGEERGFWTIETNFLPGRTFASLEDMNAQAFKWATETRANARRRNGLVPAVAWEHEIPYLNEVCSDLPPPYRRHERVVDQYGYVSFGANSYWVPTSVEGVVTVLEYHDQIKILNGRYEVASYKLPPYGTKHEVFPKDRSHIPFQPRHRARPSASEEAALRRVGPSVSAYLDFALKDKGVTRHRFIRDIHSLYRRVSSDLFVRVLERALDHRLSDVKSLERMAAILVRDGSEHVITPTYDEEYEQREAYKEGRYIDSPDLKQYDEYDL